MLPTSSAAAHTPVPVADREMARLGTEGEEILAAHGPFLRGSIPTENKISFYVNDFSLSADEPWLTPLSNVNSPDSSSSDPVVVTWTPAGADAFRHVFSEVMHGILTNEFIKAVPVSPAFGTYTGDMAQFLANLLAEPLSASRGHAFLWGDAQEGFAGLTPETLFRVEGRRLTTMALAGTADAAHADDLLSRPKLAREHAVVVDELMQSLATLGDVKSGEREIVALGSMLHLRTTLEVDLLCEPRGEDLNHLVRLLHPTPALGISPRTPGTVAQLDRWRSMLGTPPAFGAPFGAAWPGGALFLVAIRGVFWSNGKICLPAGCGIVSGSEFDAEWAEMKLKRAWVRQALGLAPNTPSRRSCQPLPFLSSPSKPLSPLE